MAMQFSEKSVKTGNKRKTIGGLTKRSLSTMKEQQDSSSNTPPVPRCSSTGSAVPVKSETGSPGTGSIKQEIMMRGNSQTPDSRQFNGHDTADLKPKLDDGGDGGGEGGSSGGGELKPNTAANFNTGPDAGPFSAGGGSGPPSIGGVTRPGRDSVTPSGLHRIQQIGPNGQPMGMNPIPTGPNGQPMNVNSMPIGPNGQPMNVNSMPVDPNGQPMSMNSSMSMGGPRVLNVSGVPGPLQGSGAGHLQLSAGGHFMQLQNRILVFSTQMANDAAEMVRAGQFKDIVDFHLCQPGTQQQLQKLAAQMQQCSNSNGGPMGMTVDGAMPPRTPLGGPGMPSQMINDDKSGGGGGGALANVAQWVQQQNINLQQERSGFPGSGPGAFGPDGGPIMKPNGRFGGVRSGSMPPSGGMDMGSGCPPPSYDMCGPGGLAGGFMHDPTQMPHPDLLHCKVPNENLTPEQLQRREEKIANLRNIKQMLFPEQQGPNGPNSMMHSGQGGMMMHGGGGPPDGMSQDMWGLHGQQLMHPGIGRMGPGQCGPPDMMGGPPDDMGFGPPFMGGGGPMIGGMMPPPNWENMTPAERDWFKLQQEHYIEKCRKQQMQQMGQGPPNRGNFMFNPMQQRIGMGGPMSPISPSMIGCGPGGPVLSPRMGPDFPGGFPPGHPMCGPDIGSFDRGGPDRMCQFHGGEGMMGPGGRMGGPCPADQFNPDMMMIGPGGCPPGHHHGHGMGGMMSKMPPGYGMSAKRKRSAASMAADSDEVCKRLLPAPSPQQFSYVDPLEGQELIITKQVNLAFQDHQPQQQQQQSGPPSGSSSPPPSSSAPSYPPPPKSRPPASKKKKSKANAVATDDQHAPKIKGHAKPTQTPPSSSSASQSQQQQSSLVDNFTCPSPAISSISGAGAATPSLSNVASPVSQSGVVGSTVLTSLPPQSGQNIARSLGSDTIKSSASTNNPMANITSSSLADLARGVENLSQHIGMQSGGPFRTVQMQDNDSDVSNGSPLGGMPISSINSSIQMQQQMNSNMDTRGVMGGGPPPRGMNRTSSAGSMQHASQQHLSELMFGSGSGNGGPMDEQTGMDLRGFGGFPGVQGGAAGRSLNPYNSMGPSPGSSSGRMVNNSGGMVTGNAKIQIQAQAPNTIQYMPSNAPLQSGPPQPGDNMNESMMGGEFIDSKPMGGGGGRGMGTGMKGMPFEMMHSGPPGGGGGGMSQAEMINRQRQMELMQEVQMMRAAELGGFGGPRPGHIHPGMMNMGMHPGAGSGSPMLGGSDGAVHRMHGGASSPMLGPGSPMMGPGGPMSAHEMMHMPGPGGMMMRGGPPGGAGHMNDIPPHHMMSGGGPMGAQSEMSMMRPNMNAMMARGNMVSPSGMVSRGGAGNFMRGGGNPGGDPMMGMGPGGGGGMRPDMAMMAGMIPGRGSDGGRMMGGGTMRGGGSVGGGKNEGSIASGPSVPLASEPRTKTGRRQSKKQQEAAAAAAAAANEARLRNEAASGRLSAGGVNSASGGGGMGGEGGGGGVAMGIGGRRSSDMMGVGGPSSEQMMQGMMTSRGNAMSPEMMMMQQQQRMSRGGMVMGGPGGGGDMMDGGGMDVMFRGFPPGRMGSHDAFDMCPPGMGGSPNIAQQGGSGGGDGMGGGGGYPSQYQQFQQQLYAQNRSPPMNQSMQGMRMGPTDMMGRPIDNIGRVIDSMGRPNDVMGRVSDMMIRPMDMMGRPIDNMGRPIDNMGRHTDGMSRPVESIGRHMDSMGQLSDMMLRPMDGMGQPMDGMGRPIDQMGRRLDQMGRPMDQMGRPMDGMGRPMDQMGRPMDQMGRPMDQMGRPMDGMIGGRPMDGLMGRHVDMMGRPMDNMGRPMDMMGGRPYDMMGNGPGSGPGNQVFGPSPPGLGPGGM